MLLLNPQACLPRLTILGHPSRSFSITVHSCPSKTNADGEHAADVGEHGAWSRMIRYAKMVTVSS